MKKLFLGLIVNGLFLVSLTTVIQARHVFVWKLSILATEYGHWLALLCVFLFLTGGRVRVMMLVLSTVLFLRPALQAFSNEKRWAQELATTFGADNPGPMLSSKKLWSFKSSSMIAPERHNYAESPENLIFDFYRTACSDPAPWVLVVHGGGWDSGDPSQFAAYNSHLALRGYSVAAISYRLAPKWKWPAQKDDVTQAIQYIKTHAKELNIDPNRWAIMGRSAGGQIAQVIAYQKPHAGLQGVVAFYSPSDLEFAYRNTTDNDIINSRALLENLLGGKPEQQKKLYDDASPLQYAGDASPATLLLHGEHDALTWVRHSRRLRDRLKEKGGQVVYIEFPWATHAFDFSLNGPGGQIAVSAVDRFFDVVLNKRGDA